MYMRFKSVPFFLELLHWVSTVLKIFILLKVNFQFNLNLHTDEDHPLKSSFCLLLLWQIKSIFYLSG